MNEIERIYRQADGPEGFVRGYLAHVQGLLAAVDPAAVAAVAARLAEARRDGATIYLLGNGGSAALASHFAADLLALRGPPRLRVGCLSDSAPVLTARGNDHGFERVFVEQLSGRVGPGDVVVAISSSGDSPNVLAAVDHARQAGATTVGLCGFSGGALAGRCDLPVIVRTLPGEYGPVEGVHAIVCHVLANHLLLSGGGAP